MDERKSSPLVPWLVAVAIIVCLGAIYAGAYVGLSTQTTKNLHTGGRCRVYRAPWIALAFIPASLAESLVIGIDVSPAWVEERSAPSR
jgi:hypothetical protein